MTYAFPLYEASNFDCDGCEDRLLALCKHHFGIAIEYESDLYLEICKAAERIVEQYFSLCSNSLADRRVMMDK